LVPKQSLIEIFAPDGPDQSLDESIRAGCGGNGLDLINLKDPKIRPASENETADRDPRKDISAPSADHRDRDWAGNRGETSRASMDRSIDPTSPIGLLAQGGLGFLFFVIRMEVDIARFRGRVLSLGVISWCMPPGLAVSST
jgi:hypothetical protein